jgi:hypothetical protein
MAVTSGQQATSATPVKILQGSDAIQSSAADMTARPISGYVQAPAANSASVFLGGSNAVAVGTGFELKAGATSPRFDLWADDDQIWVVSTAAQNVSWIAITEV